MIALFTMDELRRLALGQPETFDTITGRHKLDSPEHRSLRDKARKFIVACLEANKRDVGNVESKPISKIGPQKSSKCTIKFQGAAGKWSLEISDPNSRKPLLLWIPPWWKHHKDWAQTILKLDNKLEPTFTIAHLLFSFPSEDYTYSAALCEIREALVEIGRGIEGIQADRKPFSVASVGGNAFLTAEAVAWYSADSPRTIGTLALFAPIDDFFDAIDIVTAKPLLTRMAYLGKPGYRAVDGQFHNLQYLGQPINCLHLLDLAARGAAQCKRTYFRTNLEAVASRKIEIVIAASRHSAFGDYEALRELAEICRGRFTDVAWYVTMDQHKADFHLETALEKQTGLADALRFVEESAMPNAILYKDYRADICIGADEKKECLKQIKAWNTFCKVVFHEPEQPELNIEKIDASSDSVVFVRAIRRSTGRLCGVFRLLIDYDITNFMKSLSDEMSKFSDHTQRLVDVRAFVDPRAKNVDWEALFQTLFARALVYFEEQDLDGVYIQVAKSERKHYLERGFIGVGECFADQGGHEWWPMLLMPREVLASFHERSSQDEFLNRNDIPLNVDFWTSIKELVSTFRNRNEPHTLSSERD